MAKARLYGLFERPRGTKRWQRRMAYFAYPKPTAVRVWQNMLLQPSLSAEHAHLERSLRPVAS